MSAGWVLVQTSDGAAPVVAGALADLPGVELAEQTAGAYDVVARVADAGPEVRSAKRLLRATLRVPGVTLAVCCHDGEVPDTSERTTIDLTDDEIRPAVAAQNKSTGAPPTTSPVVGR